MSKWESFKSSGVKCLCAMAVPGVVAAGLAIMSLGGPLGLVGCAVAGAALPIASAAIKKMNP